jgi:hypothetical protein
VSYEKQIESEDEDCISLPEFEKTYSKLTSFIHLVKERSPEAGGEELFLRSYSFLIYFMGIFTAPKTSK